MLTKEFSIEESQLQRMLEILGIFYRPLPPRPAKVQEEVSSKDVKSKKRKLLPDKKEKKLECKVCHKKFAWVSGKLYISLVFIEFFRELDIYFCVYTLIQDHF